MPRHRSFVSKPEAYRFLEALRRHDDRFLAAAEVGEGVEWKHIRATLERKKFPFFNKAYDDFMEERRIRHEDGLHRRGLAGDNPASRAYLAANDPRYRSTKPPAQPQDAADEPTDTDTKLRDWQRKMETFGDEPAAADA